MLLLYLTHVHLHRVVVGIAGPPACLFVLLKRCLEKESIDRADIRYEA